MKSLIRVLLINFVLLLSFLLCIEGAAWIGRALLKKGSVGFLVYTLGQGDGDLTDPCKRMRTDPILSHVHDHQGECTVRGGRVLGQYVLYDGKESDTIILTLGGSTTDGFYSEYSDGYTWPYFLNSLLVNSSIDAQVLNGGVGAYGSSQELLKLIVDLQKFKDKHKFIISLTGINDYYAYRYSDFPVSKETAIRLPIYTAVQLMMSNSNQYIRQDRAQQIWLPSLRSLLHRMTDTSSNITYGQLNKKLSVQSGLSPLRISTKSLAAADQWEYNLRGMHALSKANKASFLAILQPTLGIERNENYMSPRGSSDRRIEESISKEYKEMMSELYVVCRASETLFRNEFLL